LQLFLESGWDLFGRFDVRVPAAASFGELGQALLVEFGAAPSCLQKRRYTSADTAELNDVRILDVFLRDSALDFVTWINAGTESIAQHLRFP